MQKKKTKWDRFYQVIDTMRMFAVCMLIVLLMFTFVLRGKTIVGESMYPTLKDGEQVFINVAASYLNDIKRFDIVVVKHASDDDLWVKRVIGLPNETVEYKDNKLFINDLEVKEPFLDNTYRKRIEKEKGMFTADYPKHTLKADEYLLVGDNRVNSLDSRSESVGPFKRSQILAKGMFVYYPFEQARYVNYGK